MNRYWAWMIETLRPLYASSLPEELALPPIPMEGFLRGEMYRSACIFNQPDNPTDVFQLVGPDLAPRAARTWRPREFYLMEEVSLSLYLVDQQRQRGILVDPQHVDRLIQAISNYHRYLGLTTTKQTLSAIVFQFLDAHSAPHPMTQEEADRPITVDHPLLNELRQVDREVKETMDPYGLLMLGLDVYDDLSSAHYGWCTPINCRTFAGTGCDGVHFSFVTLEDGISPASPVVMTTPADGGLSCIVGGHLHDFLCRGCRTGYDELLSHKLDATPEFDGRHRRCLDYLCHRLQLRPWTDAGHLPQLQRDYWPLLQLPPDVAGSHMPFQESIP